MSVTSYKFLKQAHLDYELLISLVQRYQKSKSSKNKSIYLKEIQALINRYSSVICVPRVNTTWRLKKSQYLNGKWLNQGDLIRVVGVMVGKDIIINYEISKIYSAHMGIGDFFKKFEEKVS